MKSPVNRVLIMNNTRFIQRTNDFDPSSVSSTRSSSRNSSFKFRNSSRRSSNGSTKSLNILPGSRWRTSILKSAKFGRRRKTVSLGNLLFNQKNSISKISTRRASAPIKNTAFGTSRKRSTSRKKSSKKPNSRSATPKPTTENHEIKIENDEMVLDLDKKLILEQEDEETNEEDTKARHTIMKSIAF